MSDRETGKRPLRRERMYPELRDGMSAFSSLQAAREVWTEDLEPRARERGEPVRAGDYIAEVTLTPEMGVDIEISTSRAGT